jgi:hypothetical protein
MGILPDPIDLRELEQVWPTPHLPEAGVEAPETKGRRARVMGRRRRGPAPASIQAAESAAACASSSTLALFG